MKKFIGIMSIMLIAIILTSCGSKEIPTLKMKGENLNDNQADEIIAAWEKYKIDRSEEEKLFEQWVKLDMEMLYKSETQDDESEVYMNMSGKIFDSVYPYNIKMKLTIEIEGEVKKDDVESEVNGKIKVTYLDGTAYLKVDMKVKSEGEYSEQTAKIKEEIKCDLSDILSLINIEVGENQSIFEGFTEEFMSSISVIYESSTLSEKNGTYYHAKNNSSGSDTNIERMILKMNDDYDVKKFQYYKKVITSDNQETYSLLTIKPCLGTLITKPLNENKYVIGDFNLGDYFG